MRFKIWINEAFGTQSRYDKNNQNIDPELRYGLDILRKDRRFDDFNDMELEQMICSGLSVEDILKFGPDQALEKFHLKAGEIDVGLDFN